MNDHSIAFCTCVNDEELYEECIKYIDKLNIPSGYEIEKIAIRQAKSITSAYNELIAKSESKYKVYLHQDTFIVNRNFISDCLKIFEEDKKIGMLGAVGAETIPTNAIWWESQCCKGKTYDSSRGKIQLLDFDTNGSEENYIEVQAIDGFIMITQYDVNWREDIFDGWHFYDVSQCIEFINAGYKVVIPNQENSWYVHDCNVIKNDNTYEKYRQYFLNTYSDIIDFEKNIKDIDVIGKQIKTNEYGFYDIGINTIIRDRCEFVRPEGIKLGNYVEIHRDGRFQLAYNNVSTEPRIIIGDSCQIGQRCVISVTNKIILKKNVIIASNVHITDHNHEYKKIGIPIMYQGVTSFDNEVIIGEGCWIANNVVIVGNVTIGKCTTIGANSVVINNIPDYCVAIGSPAKVVKAFDYENGEWIRITDDDELNEMLEKRKNVKPILTIGIPTYNRANYLKKCLDSIYNQVGNDLIIEVLVCDNCSTDNTEQIVREYMNQYKNITYYRNESNIGAENNIKRILEIASGRYVNIHGDDDFFNNGIIYEIINMIYANKECAVMYTLPKSCELNIKQGEGINEYIKDISYINTFISGIIIKKDKYDELTNTSKYIGSLLNHVYLQLELLKYNLKYCILSGNIFSQESGAHLPSGYNFGEVFIKNYLEILYGFKDNGLREDVLKNEKSILLKCMILPWVYKIVNENIKLDLNNLSKIVREFYSEEDHFEEVLYEIEAILKSYQKLGEFGR